MGITDKQIYNCIANFNNYGRSRLRSGMGIHEITMNVDALVTHLEQQLGIQIPKDKIEQFLFVEDLVKEVKNCFKRERQSPEEQLEKGIYHSIAEFSKYSESRLRPTTPLREITRNVESLVTHVELQFNVLIPYDKIKEFLFVEDLVYAIKNCIENKPQIREQQSCQTYRGLEEPVATNLFTLSAEERELVNLIKELSAKFELTSKKKRVIILAAERLNIEVERLNNLYKMTLREKV